MRFCLLDRISSLEPDVGLTAVKNLSLAEEYLADHFPEFPVLPGVFMLEAATQAASWLVRISENYAHSMITLQEARSVKFTDFVSPGDQLRITIEQLKREGSLVSFKFQGDVEDRLCVSGRLTVECSNLADDDPEMAGVDARLIGYQRQHQALLTRGLSIPSAATASTAAL
jgi:3-hydroxyacyl-[acyl-carrier-protein] dehydratase